MHIKMHTGRGLSRILMGAVLMATALAGAPVAAMADPGTSPGPAATSTRNEDHAMGSQIRKHEGGAGEGPAVARVGASTSSVEGLDVSAWDGTVDWAGMWADGKRFAWVKATEATSYTNPQFTAQYNGSYKQGLIRGAYHFAIPSSSSGAAQAEYFSDHGGGWSGDGKTLPGALDMEYNPYSGGTCYGLSRAAMTSWIKEFSDYYKSRWSKYPIIYTSTSWWNQCVDSAAFGSTNPLWVARYTSSAGELPAGWSHHTVWQYSADGYDHDRFNGSLDRLEVFATDAD